MTTDTEHEHTPSSKDAIEAWTRSLSPVKSADSASSGIPGGTVRRRLITRMGEHSQSKPGIVYARPRHAGSSADSQARRHTPYPN